MKHPRLIANENFPAPSVERLRALGFDLLYVAEFSPSVSDTRVMELAVAEQRWLLTFDRDYGDLIFSKGLPSPPAVIFLRLSSYRPEHPALVVSQILAQWENLLGQFVVVGQDTLRQRLLPIPLHMTHKSISS